MEQLITWHFSDFLAFLLVAVIIIRKMFFPCVEEQNERKSQADIQTILSVFSPGEKLDVLTLTFRLRGSDSGKNMSMGDVTELVGVMVTSGELKVERTDNGFGDWRGEMSAYSLPD